MGLQARAGDADDAGDAGDAGMPAFVDEISKS